MNRLKAIARQCAAELYARSPAFLKGLKGHVAILMYHRVVTDKELSRQYIQPGMYVTTKTFEKHLRFLREHFEVISFSALLSMWKNRKWDDRKRYCVITFDDGWLDNYTYALPILKEYAMPATVFVPTDFIGTDRWFWPDKLAWIYRQYATRQEAHKRRSFAALRLKHPWLQGFSRVVLSGDVDALIESCKRFELQQIDLLISCWAADLGTPFPNERQVINWNEAREMAAAAVTFGSHSASHRILTELSQDELTTEVVKSMARLRDEGLNPIPVFCYPNGNWSSAVADRVQASGYLAAITTEFGHEGSLPTNLFGLRRVGVHDHISYTDSLFAYHLAGFNSIK